MAGSIERALVAQGPLRERPFCHLLLDAQKRETSGTLTLLAEASGEVRIRLQRGRPNKALLATDATDLLNALLPLCTLAQGSFQLYEDVDLLTGVPDAISGHIDPRRLLAASLDAFVRDDVVDSVLSRYANCALRLRPRHDVSWLRLGPRDGTLLELIRAAPSTPEELIAQAPLPAERTRRLVYALLATQTLIAYDQATSQQLKRSQPVITTAPVGRTGSRSTPAWKALTSLRPDARGASRSLDPGRSSTVIRTASNATSASISTPSAAAGTPTPSGHPLPAWKTLASLRPRVISRVSSLDPGRESTPGSTPSSARTSSPIAPPPRLSGTQPVVTAPEVIAEDDIPGRVRRAEGLLHATRYEEALTEITALLKLKPDRAELHGLHARVLFEQHANDSGLPRRVLEALKKALWIDPEETNALYTRGLICKRGGDSTRALACFKRVLEVDPDHTDALRELRIAKLRGGKEAEG